MLGISYLLKIIKRIFNKKRNPHFIERYAKYSDAELIEIAKKEREGIPFETQSSDGMQFKQIGKAERALICRGIFKG